MLEGMEERWSVELSDEVSAWMDSLSVTELRVVAAAIDRLKEDGNRLGMPLSKPLGDKLFELRFSLSSTARRITYTFNPGRKVITLTTFRKTTQNQTREILRARRALRNRHTR
jgi:hypothetical protein